MRGGHGGEELPRDWDPNTAMTDLIAARVDAWRSEHGLAADEDFPFLEERVEELFNSNETSAVKPRKEKEGRVRAPAFSYLST